MTWHVQYREGAAVRLATFPTPEEAIEAGCRLIDDGKDVRGIGLGSPDVLIAKDAIARIYAFWARAKYPFGIRECRLSDSANSCNRSRIV
jgi:hypothetical protein